MEQMEYNDELSHDGFSLPSTQLPPASAELPSPLLQLSSHDESNGSEHGSSWSAQQSKETVVISGQIKCPNCPRILGSAGLFARHTLLHPPDSIRRFKCSKSDTWYTTCSGKRKHEITFHGADLQRAATNYHAGRIQTPTKRTASINSRNKTREQLADDNAVERIETQQQMCPPPPVLTQQLLPPLWQTQSAVFSARDAVINIKGPMATSSAKNGGEQLQSTLSVSSRFSNAPNMFTQINEFVDMCSSKLKNLQSEGGDCIDDLNSETRVAICEILRQNVVVRIETALTRIAADNGVPYDASASVLGLPTRPTNLKLGDLVTGLESFKSVCKTQGNLAALGMFGPFLVKPGLTYALSIVKAMLNAIEAE